MTGVLVSSLGAAGGTTDVGFKFTLGTKGGGAGVRVERAKVTMFGNGIGTFNEGGLGSSG